MVKMEVEVKKKKISLEENEAALIFAIQDFTDELANLIREIKK